jgi:hypothetical protein
MRSCNVCLCAKAYRKLRNTRSILPGIGACANPLWAQSGHRDGAEECPLLGVKRTCAGRLAKEFDSAKRLAAVLAAAASIGDYRWNSGKRRFNLGLFRGLAGVDYTVLRRLDRSLPNVLVRE